MWPLIITNIYKSKMFSSLIIYSNFKTANMTLKSYLVLILITTLVSCGDISKNIEETVDNGIKDTKTEMTSDIANSKGTFTETYKNIILGSTDSLVIKKITKFYFNINETSKYIDSLKTEINKLDDKELKNTDLIKKIFLNDGIGDRVFDRVKSSYTFAIDIALADTAKRRLKKTQDIYTAETKKQFFESNGPLGVNMLLYGIESELLKDGTKSLYGYKSK
jgi:hypothetical protein